MSEGNITPKQKEILEYITEDRYTVSEKRGKGL